MVPISGAEMIAHVDRVCTTDSTTMAATLPLSVLSAVMQALAMSSPPVALDSGMSRTGNEEDNVNAKEGAHAAVFGAVLAVNVVVVVMLRAGDDICCAPNGRLSAANAAHVRSAAICINK